MPPFTTLLKEWLAKVQSKAKILRPEAPDLKVNSFGATIAAMVMYTKELWIEDQRLGLSRAAGDDNEP